MDGEEQLIFGHSRSQCDRSANGNDRLRSLESPSTRRQRAPSYEHELMTVMEKVNRAVPANKPAAMRGRRINKAKNMQQTSTNQAITLLNSRLDTISEALGSVIIQLGVSPVSVAVGGEVPSAASESGNESLSAMAGEFVVCFHSVPTYRYDVSFDFILNRFGKCRAGQRHIGQRRTRQAGAKCWAQQQHGCGECRYGGQIHQINRTIGRSCSDG